MKINLNHLRIYFFLALTILFISGCDDAQDSEVPIQIEQNTTQSEDINLTQVNDTNATYTQDENLTQSDANTTLPIVSKLPTALNNILITQRGVTKIIDLYQAEASSYSIPNLPTWAILDVNTGKLSVEHTVTGHGLYDIELTDANGTTKSYENALRISIYPELEMLQDYADTLTPQTPTSIAPAPSTVIHTTPQFFHNPDKNSWTVCLPYYAAYTSYQQIMTVDLSTGALKVDDKTSVATASWHMFKAVSGPGSKTFIGAQGGDITCALRGGF